MVDQWAGGDASGFVLDLHSVAQDALRRLRHVSLAYDDLSENEARFRYWTGMNLVTFREVKRTLGRGEEELTQRTKKLTTEDKMVMTFARLRHGVAWEYSCLSHRVRIMAPMFGDVDPRSLEAWYDQTLEVLQNYFVPCFLFVPTLEELKARCPLQLRERIGSQFGELCLLLADGFPLPMPVSQLPLLRTLTYSDYYGG